MSYTLKRYVRYAAVLTLGVLAQLSLPSDALAENLPWRFSIDVDPLTDEASGSAGSGDLVNFVGFFCAPGEPVAKFLALVNMGDTDKYSENDIEVAWRTDNGAVRNEIWEAIKSNDKSKGVGIFGQKAFEFALGVAGAQDRIVFRNPNGTLVYRANGSAKAISQLLEFCGLKQ